MEDVNRYGRSIYERFYGMWEQPLSVVRSKQDFVAVLKIRIRKDGVIIGSELVTPSGNPAMDESVKRAAERVHQIDKPPAGVADPYEVRIQFKLDQS
jgi:TonB family protein